MKGISIGFAFCLLTFALSAQTVQQKLQNAYQNFEADTQLRHAISSLYVIDAKTGEVVFDKNSQIGLAGASTQKIVTAATAFELLTRNFGYQTFFYLDGIVRKDTLFGNFIIKGSGDPTFGSWRYAATKREDMLVSIRDMLSAKRIKAITGNIIIDENSYETNSVSDGWIWEDIGNYYGAGAVALNWNENQYDLILKGGDKENDPVDIVRTDPKMTAFQLVNELSSGPKGSGDNAYIYFPPYSTMGFVRGTIPLGENSFKISGSMPDPARQFNNELVDYLNASGIRIKAKPISRMDNLLSKKKLYYNSQAFNFIVSPSVDSIVYWFLKKSVNLYGEAFVKTFAYQKLGFGSTDSGIAIIRKFWAEKGIDEDELNIYDGSGLSPLNRLTTHAQVGVLKYAKTRDWFSSFYSALPEYNGMKMKSGTISDVKGFCGYQVSKEGKEYIFSFLVNNYSGRASSLVNKMYKVLDELK